MAKLLIFRGDTLHSTVELTEQTVQIGRSAENKIVLEDPGKGVSRVHAEIRFEGGRYVLFDRESQNGIWVSGRRVASVVLNPDVVATLGPFRLSVEAPVPVSAGAVSDSATEYTHLSEHPTEPLVLADLGPLPAQPPPPRPVHHLALSKGWPWSAQPRLWFVAGAAVLLITVLAVVAYKLVHKPSGPTWDRNLAQALVDSGKCQEALDTQINPALEVDPNNLEARTLRDKCTAPPAPAPPPMTTTSPPAPSLAERLDEAEGLITAKDCLKALDAINLVLADDPNNERAKELFPKANTCANPVSVPTVSTEALAVKEVLPSQGGLVLIPKESAKEYKARMDAKKKRYEEGESLLQSRRYQQAARVFDQIWAEPDVPKGYLSLAQLRSDAHAGVREEARRSFEAAQAADKRDDFDVAVDGYRRAHDLDSNIDIDAPLQQIDARKLQLGKKKCTEGDFAYAYSKNAEAAAAYQAAVKLLPPSDPCYAVAQDRLKRMGK